MTHLVGNCRITINHEGTFRMPDDYWNVCRKPFYAAVEEDDPGQPHLCLWPGYLAATHDECAEPTLLDMDSKQHVTVPLDLLAAAEIQPEGEAYLVGCNTRLELWSPAAWDSFLSGMLQDPTLNELFGASEQ